MVVCAVRRQGAVLDVVAIPGGVEHVAHASCVEVVLPHLGDRGLLADLAGGEHERDREPRAHLGASYVIWARSRRTPNIFDRLRSLERAPNAIRCQTAGLV